MAKSIVGLARQRLRRSQMLWMGLIGPLLRTAPMAAGGGTISCAFLPPKARFPFSKPWGCMPGVNHYKKIGQRLSSGDHSTESADTIKYLGKGKDAIVRPGVVLLAPNEEFDHFLRQAAVFIYGMGLDDHDVYVVRGVVLDHPTPFSMGEMMDKEGKATDSETGRTPILDNLLFRGGRLGGDHAILFHSDQSLANAADLEEIGQSGVYQGGFDGVLNGSDKRDPTSFKFFFNYVEFTEQEIDNMLSDPLEDENDGWISVEVPPQIVLDSNYGRGDAWKRLRNAVRQYHYSALSYSDDEDQS